MIPFLPYSELISFALFLGVMAWYLIVTIPSPQADLQRIEERVLGPGEQLIGIRRQGGSFVSGSPVRVYMADVCCAGGETETRRVGVGPVLSGRVSVWRMYKGGRHEILLRSAR